MRDIASRPLDEAGRKVEKVLSEEERRNLAEKLKAEAGFLRMVLVEGIEIVVERMPNPKKLSGTEKEMFGNTCQAMLDKYLPLVGGYAVEFGFALCVIEIFYPRWKKPDAPASP